MKKKSFIIVAITLLFVALIGLWVRNQKVDLTSIPTTVPVIIEENVGAPQAVQAENKAVENKIEEVIPRLTLENLNLIALKLKDSQSGAQNYKILQQLKNVLRSMPVEQVTPLILAYMGSKNDAQTQLSFSVNAEGYLEMSPTFRVFLMDILAELNPQAAKELSVQVLNESTAPDEWAVALRNYAWGQPQKDARGDAFFNAKVESLLGNDKWAYNPTIGYLQAFDTVVYTNNDKYMTRLVELASGEEVPESTQYAARLALIRSSEQNFPAVAEQLIHNTNMPANANLRPQVLIHADLSQEGDYEVITGYLKDPKISATEKRAFIRNYPNVVDLFSNNLLTKQTPKPMANNKISDIKSLELFQQLRQDPEFLELYPELEASIERLKEWKASIERGEAQQAATSKTQS